MESNATSLKKNPSFEWEFLERSRPVYLVGIAVRLLLLQAVPHLARGYRVDDIYSIVPSRSLPGLFAMFRYYENNMSLYRRKRR